MRTSKPIASISYNTEAFLKAKLQELYRNHRIDDWMYIRHDPEEDEKKSHIHLWISPNRLIDTMDLQDFFNEIDPRKPDKPLKCLPFSLSKEDDWILYGQHFPPYLASKGETREFIYSKEDFVYADEDTFEHAYRHALKASEWAQRNTTLNLIREGTVDPVDLLLSGVVPLNMANQLSALVTLQGKTFRNGHPNHEEKPEKPEKPDNSHVEVVKKRKEKKKREELEKEMISENPFT